MEQEKQTPLMVQYHEIKAQYPTALIMFQVGDFYELFFDDAKQAAAFLGIALTKRGTHKGEPIPLCGVPVHALDHYLHKLVKGGFCVAICDQLEVAQPGKMVKRGITQVLTPGTLTDTKLLDEKSASYLFSFFECADKWGLVFTELLTAQIYATVIPAGAYKVLEAELNRFFPDEIILGNGIGDAHFNQYFKKQGYFTSCVHESEGMLLWAQEKFSPHTVVTLNQQKAVCKALDLLYGYLKKNNEAALNAFCQLYFYQPDDFLILDPATQRNLELLQNNHDGNRADTLLATLDLSVTAMGSRTLKKWLVRPLINRKMIEMRFDAVHYLQSNYPQLQQYERVLKQIGDGERIVGRIALNRGQLHDYVHLMRILEHTPTMKQLLDGSNVALLQALGQTFEYLVPLTNLLQAALNDDFAQEWKIKKGFDVDLDRLRSLVEDSHGAILELEKKEQEATGITSLKIRYNNAHGYYIEITNANKELVPDHYTRRQTLVGRERFMSPELQILERDIMHARTEIEQKEFQLFEHIKTQVVPHITSLRKMMHALAQSDALVGFARCAYERGYVRPVLTDTRDITIVDGRHPVIEQKLGSQFIPNDTQLTDTNSLWIITGPNMGGKSTYLRQVALLSIMAQCGSFIPVKSAQLPLLDRIFTRIGASDNVAQGKSTFLVEMEETAHICQFATARSLVILDEVGRGTSTFDGLAIAQAVIEYLHQVIKPRCLFATHYHELTRLQDTLPGIVSYYAASQKTDAGIVFLHKIIKGVADGSFGLEVAKLAFIPDPIIERARVLEQELSNQPQVNLSLKPAHKAPDLEKELLKTQLTMAQKKLAQLDSLDVENLSPKQAFDFLWSFKNEYLKN